MITERSILRWMWPHIKEKMDRDQFGGLSNNSVSHYLIEITNFVLYNLDLPSPMASIATLIDFSKGFNRINHSILVKDLVDMGVPGWLTKILCSYLTGRELIVRYKQGQSEPAPLPGGTGQGTILGMWLFLFKMNKYSMKETNDQDIGKKTTDNGKRTPMEFTKKKWVDDLTEVASVNLRTETRTLGEQNLIRPLNWLARSGHHLPGQQNPSQAALTDLYKVANDNQMLVNSKKTKTMLFTRSNSTTIEPYLEAPDGTKIAYTRKSKLLGVVITDDLKTIENTKQIETKAYKRIWILRRLASLGCPLQDLITVYTRQVRSVCEFAVPYWATRITKNEDHRIERIQRTALHVIMGDRYESYQNALKVCDLEMLSTRRSDLITKFTIKTVNNPKFKHWFKENPSMKETRQPGKKYKETRFRTEIYNNSAIPAMTRILNEIENVSCEDQDHMKCIQCNQTFSTKANSILHNRYKHLQNGKDPVWSARLK